MALNKKWRYMTLLCAAMVLFAFSALASCAHDDEQMITSSHVRRLVPGEKWIDDGDGKTHSGLVESFDLCVCYLCDAEWEENYTVGIISEEHDFFLGECLDCLAGCPHEKYTTQDGFYRLIPAGVWTNDGDGINHSGMCEKYSLHTCLICAEEWEQFVADEMITEQHTFDADYLCSGCGCAKLRIILQPSSTKAALDTYAKTSVKAQGDGLSYQWYYKNPSMSGYKKSTRVSAEYSVLMTEIRDGGRVYCVVSDRYGNTLKSDEAVLEAGTELEIHTQPADAMVSLGEYAKTSVGVFGDGVEYTWYYKNPGSSKFSKSTLSGPTYSIKMTEARDGRQVYCVVKDAYGKSLTTDTVILGMGVLLKITEQPTDVIVSGDEYAKTSVKAEGSGLSYRWYYKNPNGSWTKGTCTSANYSVKMTTKISGRQIYCLVTDKYGRTVTSKTVTIRLPETKITKQPVSVVASGDEYARVSVEATGDGLSYQWYYRDQGKASFSKGATTAAKCSVKMSAARDGRELYCVVTDRYGRTVKSDTVTVRIK